jgi:hypothetical protein
MPASTRFFAISFARALIETSRMLALRILSWSVAVLRRYARLSLFLRLHTPKADLAVVEGDFVRRDLVGFNNGSYGLASRVFCRECAICDRGWIRGRHNCIRHCYGVMVVTVAGARYPIPRLVVEDGDAPRLARVDLRCDELRGQCTILGELDGITTR